MDCLFCAIIHRTIPAKILYEDEQILAFEDINPQAPSHVLIIPKQHIPTLNDLQTQQIPLAGALLYTAQHLAKELGYAETGYRIVNNCNEDGGQAVYHLHLHLLGNRVLTWPPG
jgi:histidine triad (HIT) family protein